MKIPVGTHPGAVAGTPTMETIAFSVRPLVTSRHKEFAPIGAPIGVSGHTQAPESPTQLMQIVGDRCPPGHGRYMFKPKGSYP